MKRLTKAIQEVVKKKGREIKWTFLDNQQATMVALAELGQSNKVIKMDCKFTDHQIQYALGKAQALQGLSGGYRRAWANGESDICKQVKADLLAVLRKDIQRTLPVKVAEPKAPPAPTVSTQ